MRLADRSPEYIESYGARCYLTFRCPCKVECREHITVPFDPPLDGKPYPAELQSSPWQRTGGPDFGTLTLSPSIWLHATEYDGHPGWHGFLTNGELKAC